MVSLAMALLRKKDLSDSDNMVPTAVVSDATPFLQQVQKVLTSQIVKMPDKFSVTALLDTWVSGLDYSY